MLNNSNFLKITQSLEPKFSNNRRCPDNYIGDIIIKNGKIINPESNDKCSDFKIRNKISSWQFKLSSKIILIIESPHKNEFIGSLGPAKGPTGKNIRDHFNIVIEDLIKLKDGSYPLILMNAIQYQCSLGFDTKKYRDKIFRECWDKGGSDCFKLRLGCIYLVNDVVINACTAGKADKLNKKLREMAKDAINEILGDEIKCIEVEHPSNWKREINRVKKINRTHNKSESPNFKWKT